MLTVVLLLFSCGDNNKAPGENRQITEKDLKGQIRTSLDSPVPTEAQKHRKQRSIKLIREMGIPCLEELPVVEDEKSIKPRTSEEVARRCLATAICAVKGETNDSKLISKVIYQYQAAGYFSPEETAFIKNDRPGRKELLKFSWRYECAHVMLWALGYLDEIEKPDKICNVRKEMGILRDKGSEDFIKDAKLRPLKEILDQADFYYRLHWGAVELRLKGKCSDMINEEIIMERHYALNWLIRYMNQSWDNISTDT
jgi:hypothetical protein